MKKWYNFIHDIYNKMNKDEKKINIKIFGKVYILL